MSAKPSLAMGIGMQSILKVCVANLGDRLRWMSRRKALTMIKVGLSVCLAMNFRKTQNSTRFVAYGDTKNSVGLWCEAYGYTRLQGSCRTRRHQGTALQSNPTESDFIAKRLHPRSGLHPTRSDLTRRSRISLRRGATAFLSYTLAL